MRVRAIVSQQRVIRSAAACAAFVTSAAGCSSRDTLGSTVSVRDSAGVSIVESAAPQWPADSGWRIGEPIATAGDTEILGVVGAVRLSSGTIVVTEEGGARLAFIGADGAVRWVGRSGDGPGEFRLPQAMGRSRGDTVWVYDYSSGRVTLFAPSGALVGIIPLDPPLSSALAIGSLPDGSLVLSSQWRTNAARPVQGLVRDTVAVVRYVDGVLADTLGLAAGREFVQYAEPNGRMVMSTAILPRRMSATTWGELVVLGDQVDHELHVLGIGGVVRSVIRWAGPDLALAENDVAAWIDSRIATAHPDQRDALRTLLAAAPRPDRRPAYDGILADATGALWVSAHSLGDADPARWDVFDSTGVWLGPVRIPDRFRPLDIGADWVLGVIVDELDVERIQLRSLLR
jgi:hypothetical protein